MPISVSGVAPGESLVMGSGYRSGLSIGFPVKLSTEGRPLVGLNVKPFSQFAPSAGAMSYAARTGNAGMMGTSMRGTQINPLQGHPGAGRAAAITPIVHEPISNAWTQKLEMMMDKAEQAGDYDRADRIEEYLERYRQALSSGYQWFNPYSGMSGDPYSGMFPDPYRGW